MRVFYRAPYISVEPSLTIGDLPLESLLIAQNSKIWGVPILWKLADKEHWKTDPGYPVDAATLTAERAIALLCFDAKEPNNSNTDRKNYGNNRYSQSNIDQWINSDKAAGAWYAAQHSADQAPNSTSVVSCNVYSNQVGFLNGFSAAFKAAMMATSLVVAKNTVTDGGGSETISRKVFLASNTEVGLANENNVAEGSKLALFTNDASRIAYVTTEGIANSDYTSNPANNNTAWYWWLRTPRADYSRYARLVSPGGTLNDNNAFNGHYGARPLCNIPLSTPVTPNPDGTYTIKGM